MNSTSGSLFAWAFGFSILIHLTFIGIIKFENLSLEEDEKKVINIALTSKQNNISPLDQDFLKPLPPRKDQEFVTSNQTSPDKVITPIPPEPIPLQRNFDRLPDLNNPETLVNPTIQSQPEIPRVRPEKKLKQPDRTNDFRNETALTPPPPVVPAEFATNAPQQKLPKTTISERTTNLDSTAQITEPIPQFTNVPKLAQPPSPLDLQSSPRQTQTISGDPQQLEQISPPLVASPVVYPAFPRPSPESNTSDKDLSPSSEQNRKAVSAARNEYVEDLHSTLNKRAQRKYPRKARQRCIQGTVKARIKISPTGDQLSYELTNPEETDPILNRAAESLLKGKKSYSSFAKEVSNEAVTFQVNLIYRLPHCQ